MTDVSRALEQLDEIHTRIARSHVYRGWRAVPVALSGVTGLVAAWVQPAASKSGIEPRDWVVYWLGTAMVAFGVGCAHLLRQYLKEESTAERRRTQEVLTQFLPALAVAAVITVGVMRIAPADAGLLPGLWAACFSLGVFATRPFLPTAAPLVALYYFAAAVYLLWSAHPLTAQSGWLVGGVFAVGQGLAAAVLYWSLERRSIEVSHDE